MSHGEKSFEVLAPRSRLYQGPFGRLFRELPPWSLDGKSLQQLEPVFLDIANRQMVEKPGVSPSEIAISQTLIDEIAADFGGDIPVGYTYFGQFIDHCITFDPASSLMRQNDPNGLMNHRTPRIDLDNIYGSGPALHPHLYQMNDPDKLLIGALGEDPRLPDLPRNSEGRALLGDPRNDENAIVAQLHLAFLLAHNTLVDRARDAGMPKPFEQAQNTLRWLNQHIVWNDFIKRVTSNDVFDTVLVQETTPDGRMKWNSQLSDIYDWKNQPFIPVEFSVAGYRFGHSMVRNSYQTNNTVRGFGNFAPIFDSTAGANPDNLRGFRPLAKLNYIQWDWFLPMLSSVAGNFPQFASKIDTKLANALTALHETTSGSPMNVLAFRNLMRGAAFDLPSGTAVATFLGLTPMNVPVEEDMLWFYILKEAEDQQSGKCLGQVGSIIVCATFAGLLLGDPYSYFNMSPRWTPDQDPLLQASDRRDSVNGSWELGSIIRLAGLPVEGGDIQP